VYRKDSLWLYSFGGAALILTILVYWKDLRPEWKQYQEEFRALVAEKFGESRAVQAPRGLQQDLGERPGARGPVRHLPSGNRVERHG
jgi:hypothetical protein